MYHKYSLSKYTKRANSYKYNIFNRIIMNLQIMLKNIITKKN